MLTPKEQQIEISAGLLHSFGEVTGYLKKISSATDNVTYKANLNNALNLLEQIQKAEIINLTNWCNHNGN